MNEVTNTGLLRSETTGLQFERVGRVTFELSNWCPLAKEHVKCPLHAHAGASNHLPSAVVRQVLDELGEHGFSGRLSFHNYSEPMTDPRLFMLIGYAADVCPDGRVFIMTNGWGLDQPLLDDLGEFPNVRQLEASGYSDEASDRIASLQMPQQIEFKLFAKTGLDDRLTLYDREPREPKNGPMCDAPFGEIIIRHTGEVGLCCFDWGGSVTFGDVRQGLIKVLQNPEMDAVWKDLTAGKRTLPVCQRCGVDRREKGK